jgi:hypothetical protein
VLAEGYTAADQAAEGGRQEAETPPRPPEGNF